MKFIYTSITLFFLCFQLNAQNLSFSGGRFHSVVLCDDGNVYTFGKGTEGQIGNNSTADQNQPTRVRGIGGTGFLQNIKQVDAGSGGFTLALSECGDKVYAWGDNTEGQLGISSTTPFSSVPLEVAGLPNIRFISGGNGEAYAITDNNEILAWGGNNVGQLGRGTTTVSEITPAYVMTGPGTRLTNVKLVDGGDDFGVALLYDGTVWFWGADARGVGGQGADIGDPGVTRSYAVQVRDQTGTGFLQNIEKITAGDRHILALSSGDTLFSWGANWARQVGNNNGNANQPLPTPVLNVNNSGGVLTGVRSFAAGNAHSVAVLSNGNVVSWGLRRFGQLGDNLVLPDGGDGSPFPVYTLNAAGSGNLTNIVNVSDGDNWSFAVDNTGNVYVWGQNTEGQLGLTNNTDSALPVILTLPCTVAPPEEPPFAKLANDTILCSPISLTLDAKDAGAGFSYEWFKDGGTAISGATNKTYMINSPGVYSVTITKTTNVCGTPKVETSSDNIIVSQYSPNFADPGNLKFCTDASVNVLESGSAVSADNKYEWYASATGGTSLGESSDGASVTINTATLIKTGTTPSQIATVWVEDISTFNAVVAKPSDISFSNPPATFGRDGDRSRINFTTQLDLKLNSIDITVVSSNDDDEEIVIYESNGTEVIRVPITGFTTGTNIVTKTVSFGGVELSAGDYYIESPEKKVRVYPNGDTDALGIYTADGKSIIEFTSIGASGDEQSNFPMYLSWDVTVGDPYPCGRVEVKLAEDCPACSQPTAITFNPTSVHDICLGATLPPFNVSATTPGAALNTAFTISISKDGGSFSAPTGIGATDDPTATLPLTGNATAAQDGVYTVRIEDGNTGDAGCYFEADFELNVISPPLPSTTALIDFCESTTPVPTWNATAATGYELRWHTAATGGGNATTRPAIPTSPTGTKNIWVSQRLTAAPNCQSARVALDVDVLANPSAPGVVALEYCRNQTGVPALTATGTNLQWYGTNATGGTGSGTAPTPSTATVATTSYYVTQSSSTTPACESPRAQLDVTINATPSAPGVAALEYCKDETGVPALTATGTNLQWYGTDATGGTGSGTAPTPSTATAGMASYYVTQSSTGPPACESPRAKLDVTINALPTAVLSGTETVCIGGNADLTVTVTGGTGPYNFTYDSPSTTGVAVSGATSPYALNVSTVGNYSLSSLVDAKGCAATAASLTGSGSLDTIPRLVVTPANDVCNFTTKNYTIDLAISGGSPTYTVTGMGETTTGLSAGTHTTTAVDGSNAGGSQSYSYTITDNSGCTGTEYTQTITGTKNCDCPVTGSIGLTTGSSAEICANETTSLTVTLGNGTTPPYDFELLKDGVLETTYTGETGPVTIGGINETATYTIANVKDGQCTGSASGSVGIDVFPIPVVTISSDFTEVCEQGTPDRIVITATVTPATSKGVNEMTIFRDGISAKFESTPLQSFSQLSYVADRPSKSGSYTATANNQVCPVSSISSPVDAKVWGQPQILAITAQDETQAIPDTVTVPAIIRRSIKKGTMKDIGVGAIMFPQVGDDNYTYFWTTAEPANEDVIKFGASKNANIHLEEELIEDIILEVTNGLCVERKEYLLQVLYPLFVPNAFSPNGDGTNDFWEISGLADFPSAVVSVFNRWGNKLYEEKNYSEANAWDGENSPVGTYYYIIKLNKEGWETPLTGAVTITR